MKEFNGSCPLKKLLQIKNRKPNILKHLRCVKRVRIRSYSGPHFFRIFPHSDWIRRDTTYSVPMRENPGKMLTRITPNADSFYAVYATFITGKKANLRRHHTIAATAISSHSHIRRKQSQIIFLRCSCSVTLIKIVKKYLWRKIH